MIEILKYTDPEKYEMTRSVCLWLGKDIEDEDIKIEDTVDVDMLQVEYEDYMLLHTMFGDKEYKVKADEILEELKVNNLK